MGFQTFRNGWIGVDFFFVISGFLMWHLYAEKLHGSSIIAFYVKRFQRLLPALSISILLTGLGFIIRLSSSQRDSLINELFAASLGLSNIYYWLVDQHSSNSDLRPLITLWSISLELQFYIIFPLIVFFVKQSRNKLLFLIILSFIAFAALGYYSYETKIYTLPGKLLEFFVGMLAATLLKKSEQSKTNFQVVRLLFTAFIFLSLFVTLNDRNRMVWQVLGAAISFFYIVFGFHSLNASVLERFFAKIGDYSYSIYLVHFPLFVYIGYSKNSGNPVSLETPRDLIIYSASLVISSWTMKKLIEDSNWFKNNYMRLFIATLLVTATLFFFKESILGL
jgi:peptidoglycan/LPS O-acetylase OafA/YrhL